MLSTDTGTNCGGCACAIRTASGLLMYAPSSSVSLDRHSVIAGTELMPHAAHVLVT